MDSKLKRVFLHISFFSCIQYRPKVWTRLLMHFFYIYYLLELYYSNNYAANKKS